MSCRSVAARVCRGFALRGSLTVALLAALAGCGPSINVPAFSPAELARLHEQAGELARLVGGDSAGDSLEDRRHAARPKAQMASGTRT